MDTLTVKCWKLDWPSATMRLVALAIARRARDNGACWAKQKTLADDTTLSPKTVQRALADMEALDPPRIKRTTRRRADGSRSSDYIWLTLPEVVLSADSPSANEIRRHMQEGEEEADTLSPPVDSASPCQRTDSPQGPPTESTLKESLKDSLEEKEGGASPDVDSGPPIDWKMAVEAIWRSASDQGRARSAKPDLEEALRSAIKRRPAGVTEDAHMRRIMLGIRAYLQTPDARKEEGAFQRGIHRIVTKDRWESFLDGDSPIPVERLTMDPAIGTDAAPGVALQRLWAELASQGMPWNDERGPRPGRPGCRIDPAIQREFGFTPWEGEQPLDIALAEPLALPSPESSAAPAGPDAGDDDATAFM
jgi:hypothetical protein